MTLSEQFKSLIAQYQDPPRGTESRRQLEHALQYVERALIGVPPRYQGADGGWRQRRTGLITPEQVRAGATAEGLTQLDRLAIVKAPRVRDVFKIIPERDVPDAIAEKKRERAENIHRIKFQWDQDGDGSCASEGGTGALAATQDKQGQKVEKLNPLFAYRLCNGGHDGGSSLSDNIAVLKKYGVPRMSVWPRSKGWRAEPSDEAWHDALNNRLDEVLRVTDKLEMITAMIHGPCMIYAGYPGHAWYAADPIDLTRFWWKNSWGSDWGENGASTLRYDQIAWYYGVWAFLTAVRPAA